MPEKEKPKFYIFRLRMSSGLLWRLGNIAGKKGMPTPDLINLVLQDYAEAEEMVDGTLNRTR